ncbi:hypothetical protein TrST_g6428 [Triparma strigata]|uniref:WW domain-containing protein n=1 Tax=Triparma strigata TaxID=1606541 RepID=A0A9W7BWI6_9STRA|nr:hypothetical protein TrST_g6428 [Triparma strigata]
MPRPIRVPMLPPTLHAHNEDSSDNDSQGTTPPRAESPQFTLGEPPAFAPTFQIKARKKLAKALQKWEDSVKEDEERKKKLKMMMKSGDGEAGVNVLKFRAKYVRQTTASASTRIVSYDHHNHVNPSPYPASLPSITGNKGAAPVLLYSPRSFDRPLRTPFVEPPPPEPVRLSTPEFKAAVNFQLGPEAPLMWNTIKASKRMYKDEWGGEVRGQTRALAYRYLRYIHGAKDFSDGALREYMLAHKKKREEADKLKRGHENVLADVIRDALDKEEVANIKFNKEFITEEQMKLIMLKAATTEDQVELFHFLIDEVTEEMLFCDKEASVPRNLKLVEIEIVNRMNDEAQKLDPLLCTYTLRQLRDELKRYGKSETEFRKELSMLPDVTSQAVRGCLRKRCLIDIVLQMREMYGVLKTGEVIKAQERPWTRIIRTGTASEGARVGEWEKRRRRIERKRREKDRQAGLIGDEGEGGGGDDFGGAEANNKTFVDPWVRKEMVEALLEKHRTANSLRKFMKSFNVTTVTEGVKGEARRVKMANNLVDSISKKDDLFRAWKAVLLQGKHKIISNVSDDLLDFEGEGGVASRGLSSRGLASRRRSSRLRMRPHSTLWRPDGSIGAADDFNRPGTENDWVKQKRKGGKGEEWRNRVTGEIIPIRMFFSPESEPGGFGIDYLEGLLERGVSLPMKQLEKYSMEGMSLEHGFVPPMRPSSAASDYDDEFDEYFRKRKLRMKERGEEWGKGTGVAHQRSLLEARKRYDKKKRRGGNAYVVGKGGGSSSSEEEEEEDVSDTEYVAEHIVSEIEAGIPSWFFEDLLMRFGAGPPKKPKKKGEAGGGGSSGSDIFSTIEFRDENYNSLEEFKFYYSRLEVPVARNKALMLRELKMRVEVVESGRAKLYDGESDEDDDDDDDNNDDDAFVVGVGVDVGEGRDSSGGLDLAKHSLEPSPSPSPDNTEPEPESEPVAVPLIGWARYTDDNGWPYFYNHKTGESTYENPFDTGEDSSDEEDSDFESFEERRKKEQARLFMEFCCIIVQARVRGAQARKKTRFTLAKRFRKVLDLDSAVAGCEEKTYVYEDLQDKKIHKRRPSLFNYVFPNSKF